MVSPVCSSRASRARRAGNRGQRFHPGQQRPRGRPLGERVGDDGKLECSVDVAAEFVSDDGGLGAPEAGRDEDRVGLGPAVHERLGPGNRRASGPGSRTSRPNPVGVLATSLRVTSGKKISPRPGARPRLDLALHARCTPARSRAGRSVRAASCRRTSEAVQELFDRGHEAVRLVLVLRVMELEHRYSFVRSTNWTSSLVRAQPMQPNAGRRRGR